MLPIDPTGLVTAGLDLVGGVFNANQTRDAFKHRYQDTVKDMKKAGLNPALAYGQGGGNPQTTPLPEIGSSYAKGAQSAASAQQSKAAAELTKTQTDLLQAQREDIIAGTRLKNAELFNRQQLLGIQGANEMFRQEQIQEVTRGLALDNEYKKATLQDRIDMISAELKKKGIEMSYLEIQKVLASLEINQGKAFSDFYGGAGYYTPYTNAAGDIFRNFTPRINIGGDRTFNTNNYVPGRR